MVNGQIARSVADTALSIPQASNNFPTLGHIMLFSKHTLIGVGPICDADCTVECSKHNATVLLPTGNPILTGWRDKVFPAFCNLVKIIYLMLRIILSFL